MCGESLPWDESWTAATAFYQQPWLFKHKQTVSLQDEMWLRWGLILLHRNRHSHESQHGQHGLRLEPRGIILESFKNFGIKWRKWLRDKGGCSVFLVHVTALRMKEGPRLFVNPSLKWCSILSKESNIWKWRNVLVICKLVAWKHQECKSNQLYKDEVITFKGWVIF